MWCFGGQYGDEVQEAEWVREISFVPSVARWHEWLERTDPPVQEAKAKLREWKVPDLAAVPNSKTALHCGRQVRGGSVLAALGVGSRKGCARPRQRLFRRILHAEDDLTDSSQSITSTISARSSQGAPRLIYDRAEQAAIVGGWRV